MTDRPDALTRRSMLKGSSATLAGIAGASWLAPRAAAQAGGDGQVIRFAVIGCGGRGQGVGGNFLGRDGVRITACIDPDQRRATAAAAKFAEAQPDAPDVFVGSDPREALDRDDVDAVIIATPNHWHALAAVWACMAGKHVYVEKPVAHNVWEGQRLADAAEHFGVCVQCGTQQASHPGLIEASELIRAGGIGDISGVRTGWYRDRNPIGLVRTAPDVPDHINLDSYCGPRPLAAPLRRQFHYDWHWQSPFGNGEIGNSAIHPFNDGWWMPGLGVPTRVFTVGGRFVWPDNGDTPNTCLEVFDYDGLHVTAEISNLTNPPAGGNGSTLQIEGNSQATVFYGSDATIFANRGGARLLDDGRRFSNGNCDHAHAANFLEAVRANDPSILRAAIAQGEQANRALSLGDAGYHAGPLMSTDDVERALADSTVGAAAFEGLVGLLEAHGIQRNVQPWVCSGWMTLADDGLSIASSTGVEPDAVNALLREEYREPYTIPESF